MHRSTDQRAQSLTNLLFLEGSEFRTVIRSAASDMVSAWFRDIGNSIIRLKRA
jgi:hypothetical protein